MIFYDGSGNQITIDGSESGIAGYNTWEKVLYSADTLNISYYKTISHPLPKGHYALRADRITSSDTDSDTCYLYFGPGTNDISRWPDETKFYLPRTENVYMEFDLFWDINDFTFACGENYVVSVGDTATIEGLVITKFDDNKLGEYPFWGKKFAFIGDSFSEGDGAWHRVMCKELHALNHRMTAISGARWTHNSIDNIPSAYEQAQQLVASGATPDYIYVFLGVNDWGHSITIGQTVQSRDINDFDQQTLCGGVQACLNYLQNNYPDAVIRTGFTPNGRYFNQGDCIPYATAIKETSAYHSVQYMDVLTCGVTPLVASYDSGWQFSGNIMGGHPREYAHRLIGKAIARKTLHG